MNRLFAIGWEDCAVLDSPLVVWWQYKLLKDVESSHRNPNLAEPMFNIICRDFTST